MAPPKDEPTSERMLNYDSIKQDPDGRVIHPAKRGDDVGDPFRSTDAEEEEDDDHDDAPSTEYVLNVAFFSFIGFVVFQTVFALIAHSESMLADSQAMAVDAMTYLFNLCAERTKHRPPSPNEMNLPIEVREYRKELRRLYLELIPPTISVITLIAVTVMTLREAFASLWGQEEGDDANDDEDVSVTIMLLFSAANLLLDFVNVTCFARANSTFGLNVVHEENESIRKSIRMSFALPPHSTDSSEGTALLPLQKRHHTETPSTVRRTSEEFSSNDEENYSQTSLADPTSAFRGLVNLNMCSAWTVR